jgi:hypothetical protein
VFSLLLCGSAQAADTLRPTTVSDADEAIAGVNRAVTARVGRTVRIAMSARLLRRVARHTGQPLGLFADVRDRAGDYAAGLESELRFMP